MTTSIAEWLRVIKKNLDRSTTRCWFYRVYAPQPSRIPMLEAGRSARLLNEMEHCFGAPLCSKSIVNLSWTTQTLDGREQRQNGRRCRRHNNYGWARIRSNYAAPIRVFAECLGYPSCRTNWFAEKQVWTDRPRPESKSHPRDKISISVFSSFATRTRKKPRTTRNRLND